MIRRWASNLRRRMPHAPSRPCGHAGVGALTALSFLLGCGTTPPPTATSVPTQPIPSESFPSPATSPTPVPTVIIEPQSGAFEIRTNPERATETWVFRLVSDDGRESPPEAFASGETVLIGGNLLPGPYAVLLNDRRCGSSTLIEGGVEVLVRVDVAQSGECVAVVTGRRDLPN